MSNFIDLEIETDPDELAQLMFDRMAEEFPGWLPSPGNLETILIEAIAQNAAVVRDVASVVPSAIFRYFGASLALLPPVDATRSTVTSTWTAIDSAGYTIEAGTLVGIEKSGDETIAFEVLSEVVIPPASTATAAGEVILSSVDAGAESAGLSGAVTLLDPLDWVDSVALVGSTSGGADAEEDSVYLSRLTEELRLLTPRPIIPSDFEQLARRNASVDRALAVDGYDPSGPTTGNDRTITVIMVDAAGEAVSTGVKNEVIADLAAKREVNFDVFTTDPTYTTIDVTYTAKTDEGRVVSEVEAAADAAIAAFLDPSDWGVPRFGDTREWNETDTVRYLELAQAINEVDGIDYIETLTLREDGGVHGTADVVITGPGALTRAGVITSTVTNP